MVKLNYVKEYKKGDTMTIFWYSLKILDPRNVGNGCPWQECRNTSYNMENTPFTRFGKDLGTKIHLMNMGGK
jgi:hypothetical protein